MNIEEQNDFFARYYLARDGSINIDAKVFSGWAIEQLEKGIDTKSLRILSSMLDEKDSNEIIKFFLRCLDESKVELPDKKECLIEYAKQIQHELVSRKVVPIEACYELRSIYYSLDYFSPLLTWESIYWVRNELTIQELERAVFTEASKSLAGIERSLSEYDILHEYQRSNEDYSPQSKLKKLIQAILGR